jgi:peptide deformylase
MALREIVAVPHSVLRRKARRVTDFGPEFQTLVEDMVETMREAPGVGLAATQVNVPLRLIVVEFGDEEDENVPPRLYVMANPEIVRQTDEKVVGTEGCLSVPGFIGDVERLENITVQGQNRHGKPTRVKASGWLARIFQHEIDHLNGVLFTDLALRVWRPAEGETVPRD